MTLSKWCLLLGLVFLSQGITAQAQFDEYGALIRSDVQEREIYLCFTGHDFKEGFEHVIGVLDKHQIKGSFFLTGDFIRTDKFYKHLEKLIIDFKEKNYRFERF